MGNEGTRREPEVQAYLERIGIGWAQAPSPFRLNRMANIKTESGAYDLRNSTFTEYRGDERIVTELPDAESVDRVLREKFGIVRDGLKEQ